MAQPYRSADISHFDHGEDEPPDPTEQTQMASNSQRRVRITKKGSQILKEAYDKGIRWPDEQETQKLLERIKALPKCSHFSIQNLETWFTRQNCTIAEKPNTQSGVKKEKRCVISKEGATLLHKTYDSGIHRPSDEQKLNLLQEINALPGCEHYTLQTLNQWFAFRRFTEKKKMKESSRPCTSPQSASSSSTPMLPITQAASEQSEGGLDKTLRVLLAETPDPSKLTVLTWARLLGASVEVVDAWIVAERKQQRQRDEKLRVLFRENSDPSDLLISAWSKLLGISVEDIRAWKLTCQQEEEMEMDDQSAGSAHERTAEPSTSGPLMSMGNRRISYTPFAVEQPLQPLREVQLTSLADLVFQAISNCLAEVPVDDLNLSEPLSSSLPEQPAPKPLLDSDTPRTGYPYASTPSSSLQLSAPLSPTFPSERPHLAQESEAIVAPYPGPSETDKGSKETLIPASVHAPDVTVAFPPPVCIEQELPASASPPPISNLAEGPAPLSFGWGNSFSIQHLLG